MGAFYGNTRKLSYEPGETLEIRITASDYNPYTLAIFRIGSNGGNNDPVWQSQNLTPVGENYFTLLVLPDNWKSGYYQIRRGRDDDQHQQDDHGEIFFVLRSAPGRRAKILLVLSTNTYYAYNYPGRDGGNFYDEPRQFELSFERHLKRGARPAQKWIPNAGYWPRFESSFYSWEWPFIRWAEPLYSIDYAINSDLEFHPELLNPSDPDDKYNLMLSVGHDEYWSVGMRNNLEAFIRSGGNVAFFSGNVCCWLVRLGDEGRTMICYRDLRLSKHPEIERQDRSLLTMMWSHPLVQQPPENALTGVGLRWGGNFPPRYEPGTPPQHNPPPAPYPSEYTVYRPEHWVFAGCDFKLLDKFGRPHEIVGYECDGCDVRWVDGLPFPTTEDGTPRDFEVLALSPLVKIEAGIITPGDASEWECLTHDDPKGVVYNLERRGRATLGIYANGGRVFTVGSTDWSLALSPHDGSEGDSVVQQITRNVLNELGGSDMAWRMVYEHDANGSPVFGNLNDLTSAVEKGADVRVMTADSNVKVAFTAEFVWIINGVVYAQNNQNISVNIQVPAGGTQVMFSDDSYHSFVMVNTNGYRDETRWLVGDHIAKGHTQDRVGVKWFVR